MNRSITSIAVALFTLTIPLPTAAQAINGKCRPVFDAVSKMVRTPTRVFTTETTAFRSGGKPTTKEVIYAGGAIYTKVNTMWIRSAITSQEMVQQEQAEHGGTCRYVRDELVGSETAAVYSTHSETPDLKSDAQIWISKSRGVPLREEIDTDVGGKLGRSHRSMRYEYGNVQRPVE